MGVFFKRTLCALVGACAAVVATPSMAVDYNLGTLQTGVATPAAGYLTSASPTDRIFFSLSATDDLGSTVGKLPKMTIALAPGLNLDFGLSSLTADLYSASTGFVGHLASLTGGYLLQASSVSGLSAGNYFVSVTGTPYSTFPGTGGSYALALTATQAASAPGPAGILFVGGAAALMAGRRRRQKAKAEAALA